MKIKKIITITLSAVFALFFSVSPAFAHVSVKPGEAGVGERVNFAVSVPTEETDPTVEVRLVLPEGLQSVRPNAKPGWKIELKKIGDGEEATVTEIIWSGGTIPAEQRDEFVFNAQVPAKETNLIWKAYQKYGDGDIVAWENDPKVVQEYTKNNPPKDGEDDHSAPRPYSETKVINDLKETGDIKKDSNYSFSEDLLIGYGVVAALVMSGASLWMQIRRKH